MVSSGELPLRMPGIFGDIVIKLIINIYLWVASHHHSAKTRDHAISCTRPLHQTGLIQVRQCLYLGECKYRHGASELLGPHADQCCSASVET